MSKARYHGAEGVILTFQVSGFPSSFKIPCSIFEIPLCVLRLLFRFLGGDEGRLHFAGGPGATGIQDRLAERLRLGYSFEGENGFAPGNDFDSAFAVEVAIGVLV